MKINYLFTFYKYKIWNCLYFWWTHELYHMQYNTCIIIMNDQGIRVEINERIHLHNMTMLVTALRYCLDLYFSTIVAHSDCLYWGIIRGYYYLAMWPVVVLPLINFYIINWRALLPHPCPKLLSWTMTSAQRWANAGPPPAALAQNWPSIVCLHRGSIERCDRAVCYTDD